MPPNKRSTNTKALQGRLGATETRSIALRKMTTSPRHTFVSLAGPARSHSNKPYSPAGPTRSHHNMLLHMALQGWFLPPGLPGEAGQHGGREQRGGRVPCVGRGGAAGSQGQPHRRGLRQVPTSWLPVGVVVWLQCMYALPAVAALLAARDNRRQGLRQVTAFWLRFGVEVWL